MILDELYLCPSTFKLNLLMMEVVQKSQIVFTFESFFLLYFEDSFALPSTQILRYTQKKLNFYVVLFFSLHAFMVFN